MKIRLMMAAVAAMAMAVPAVPVEAQGKAIYFHNYSDWAVWVTVYRGPGRSGIEAVGCVPGGNGVLYLVPKSPTYSILSEVKESKTSCSVHSNRKTFEPGARESIVTTTYKNVKYATGLDIAIEQR